MPGPRTMSDMLILPNGEIIIINGAAKGVAGWDMAIEPVLTPFLYRPAAPVAQRFFILAATAIPRMYHSTANVMPDGRVIVGGSNPHAGYVLTGSNFPTELRLEAYSPYYLDKVNKNSFRPKIISMSSSSVSYGTTFRVVYSVPSSVKSAVQFNVYAPSFTTHTNSMNQRLLGLAAGTASVVSNAEGKVVYSSSVTAPPGGVAAPPGYYMLFVVNSGVPSSAKWIRFA